MKLKIILSFILAIVVVVLLTKLVFLADTPRISPMVFKNLLNLPRDIASIPTKIIETIEKQRITAIVKKIPLQQISKGVYAGENKKENVYVLEFTKDTPWQKKQVTLPDGRIVTIYSYR